MVGAPGPIRDTIQVLAVRDAVFDQRTVGFLEQRFHALAVATRCRGSWRVEEHQEILIRGVGTRDDRVDEGGVGELEALVGGVLGAERGERVVAEPGGRCRDGSV
jgi:hypothetical protein